MVFGWMRRNAAGPAPSGPVKVGWVMSETKASFIWPDPAPAKPAEAKMPSPRAVGMCPAVADHEARLFEVTSPVDFNIGIIRGPKGQPVIVPADGRQGTIGGDKLRQMVALMPRDQWRHPERPVIQIITPYRFVTEDRSVYLNQLPPMNSYLAQKRPGLMIGGRFPIYAWPRILMWGFEWHEPKTAIRIKRGEPLFHVRFETADPSRGVRLVAAEWTEDLRRHCDGLDGVSSYVNQTYSLFKTAEARRPKRLLVEKPAST